MSTPSPDIPTTPRFELGTLRLTPGARDALVEAEQEPDDFFFRHRCGDWGELSEADKRENEFSIGHGLRILSAYRTAKGTRLWVITEADRSSTTLLRPDEY